MGSCPGGISTGVLASPVRAYAYDDLGFGCAVSRYSSNAFRTATNRAPRLAVPERLMEQSTPLSAIVDGERHWLISPCCKRPAAGGPWKDRRCRRQVSELAHAAVGDEIGAGCVAAVV